MADTGRPGFSAEDHSRQTDLGAFTIGPDGKISPDGYANVQSVFESDEDADAAGGRCLTTDGHHFYRCELCGAVRDDDR